MTIGLAHYLDRRRDPVHLGVFGIFLNRKNVIVILMSVELILLAVNINLVAFSAYLRRPGRADLRHVRPDRRRGRGRHRPGHPGHLLPQPRQHRGRRHLDDEGLRRMHGRRHHLLRRCSARLIAGPVRPPARRQASRRWSRPRLHGRWPPSAACWPSSTWRCGGAAAPVTDLSPGSTSASSRSTGRSATTRCSGHAGRGHLRLDAGPSLFRRLHGA